MAGADGVGLDRLFDPRSTPWPCLSEAESRGTSTAGPLRKKVRHRISVDDTRHVQPAPGIVHLTELDSRHVSGAEMVASLVPPPQFDERDLRELPCGCRVPLAAGGERDTHGVSPASRRSAGEARRLLQPPEEGTGDEAGRLPRRRIRRRQDPPAGRDLSRDACCAGSTSARSSSTRALVGALGYKNTVDLFRGSDLLCIDEFELDDPGDTMVMTRLLGELVASGTRLAATSNTPPNALGEGTVRRAGLPPRDPCDVRRASRRSGSTGRLPPARARRTRGGAGPTRVRGRRSSRMPQARGSPRTTRSTDLIAHLARVHPSRYIRLDRGLSTSSDC